MSEFNINFWRKYIPKNELSAIHDIIKNNSEESGFMINLLDTLSQSIEHMPQLKETESMGFNARVWLHYFFGGTDIYITELDKETGEGFGFTCLNGDKENAELGYLFLPEIVSIDILELDLYFNNTTTIGEIMRQYGKNI